ncbi:MFS transporter [Nocardia asteroides]|uniref:MFS transporter n=1 Tax=Nocardia asteroides TaxID=1824 RepID=UPI0037C681AA
MTQSRFLSAQLADYREILADSKVRTILSASVLNTFGTGLYSATFVLWVLRGGVSVSTLTLVLSAGAFLALFLAPVGAVVAERWGARNVAVALSAVRGALNVVLALALPPNVLAGVLFGVLVLDRLAFPASQAVVQRVSAGAMQSSVLAARQLTQTFGLAAGAMVAAIFQLAVPESWFGWLIVLNGVSFFVNAVLFARLPADAALRPQKLPWTDGWPRGRVALFLVALAIVDIAGSATGLGLPIYLSIHHNSMIGWVGVAVAVTTWIGTAMTFFAGRLFAPPGASRRYLVVGTVLVGAACALIGVAPLSGNAGLVTILLFAAAIGAGAALASFAGYYQVMGIAEEGYRERVLASYGLSGSLQRLIAPVVLSACIAIGDLGWLVFGAVAMAGGVLASFALGTQRSENDA